jgi:hypothetical protein
MRLHKRAYGAAGGFNCFAFAIARVPPETMARTLAPWLPVERCGRSLESLVMCLIFLSSLNVLQVISAAQGAQRMAIDPHGGMSSSFAAFARLSVLSVWLMDF